MINFSVCLDFNSRHHFASGQKRKLSSQNQDGKLFSRQIWIPYVDKFSRIFRLFAKINPREKFWISPFAKINPREIF